MKKDILIDEIRAVRLQISAEFGHNTRAISKHYRQMENKYKDRILREPITLTRESTSK